MPIQIVTVIIRVRGGVELNIIDQISIISVPLVLKCHNGETIGTATGFFWRARNGRTFLVSNFHVFSGNHYIMNNSNASDSAFPAQISYPRLVSEQHPEDRSIHDVTLCDEAGNDQAWKVHPIHLKYPVDVAVVEIPTIADDGSYVFAVNDNQFRECDKPLHRYSPGFEMIIAGFFLKDRPTGYFPTYIKASVASEMDALYNGKRAFLVDALTSSGMSGSPVFATGMEANDPSQKFGGGFKTVPRFVGIYSGRIIEIDNGRRKELQVGLVWRRELIHEIIEMA